MKRKTSSDFSKKFLSVPYVHFQVLESRQVQQTRVFTPRMMLPGQFNRQEKL